MIPIVSIVGKSDSGKTFLIEQLVSALASRGYRIATIKHDVHGFEMDREGKDSWRHKQAGACTVIVSSPRKIAMIKEVEQEESLEWIRDMWIRDVDLILTEGYKRADYPKVEVSLFTASGELICTKENRLVAVVANHDVSLDVPVFCKEEIPRFVDWMEERFLKSRGSGSLGKAPP
jgi:molybdopterin-guanine dinucleotide biosynthesis protein B